MLGYGMLLVCVLGFLVVLTDPSSLWDFVPLVFIAGPALYTATRVANCAVILHQHRLEVVNPFVKEQLDWKEVRTFTLGRYGPFPEMGFVVLEDGRRIHIWGIQSRNPVFTNDDAARALIEQLNDELHERLGRHTNHLRPAK
jgi:hypothetical protein